MKRSLILVLLMALLIPGLVIIGVAGFGMSSHEKAMSRVMESYVLSVAESVASKINSLGLTPVRLNRAMTQMEKMDLFTWGPELPGMVAVFDSYGNSVAALPGAEDLSRFWTQGLHRGPTVQVMEEKSDKFTVAIYPVTGKAGVYYVVAAVRWGELLGPVASSTRVWMLLLVIVAISAAVAILILWRWIIGPLNKLSNQISVLRWGEEFNYPEDPSAVVEVRNLQRVIARLSVAAKDRLELWQRYTRDMVRILEDEKSRLARELHDSVVQEVTALIQRIRLARMNDGSSAENLRIAEDIGVDTVRELRAMCDQLTPPWLDLGVGHALTELTERLIKYNGISIDLDVRGEALNPDGVLAFFRLTQEAVSNAVKHGKAKHVSIVVDHFENRTMMKISDDGKGFNPPDDFETLRASGHRGLLNMKERVQLIGGEMHIVSSIGNGTTMIFTVPDAPERQDDLPYDLEEIRPI